MGPFTRALGTQMHLRVAFGKSARVLGRGHPDSRRPGIPTESELLSGGS